MKTQSALAGSTLFLLVAPGVVAGLVPWLLMRWDERPFALDPLVQIPGALMVLTGIAFLLHAFGRFVLEGGGTPAPVAPTERLVVGGVYRYVRNPMYLAVTAIIIGQALFFRSFGLLVYAGIAGATKFAFAKIHEEPLLARRYGAEYDAYRRAVPGWLPRLRPWRG